MVEEHLNHLIINQHSKKREPSYTFSIGATTMKSNMEILKIELPYDPAIPLPRFYPTDIQCLYKTVFIALFVTVKPGNNPSVHQLGTGK